LRRTYRFYWHFNGKRRGDEAPSYYKIFGFVVVFSCIPFEKQAISLNSTRAVERILSLGTARQGKKAKRLKAGWDNDYLLRVLAS